MKKEIYVIAVWDYDYGRPYPSVMKQTFKTFDEAKAFLEKEAKATRDQGPEGEEMEVRWDSENHADLTYGFDDLVAYSIEKVEVDIE